MSLSLYFFFFYFFLHWPGWIWIQREAHNISEAPSPAEGMKNTKMDKPQSFKMQKEEKITWLHYIRSLFNLLYGAPREALK